jgi:hypothetical protein
LLWHIARKWHMGTRAYLQTSVIAYALYLLQAFRERHPAVVFLLGREIMRTGASKCNQDTRDRDEQRKLSIGEILIRWEAYILLLSVHRRRPLSSKLLCSMSLRYLLSLSRCH